MKVAVIGTGHVGLVTCVTFANIGHDVVGTDVDSEKTELLTSVSPFSSRARGSDQDRDLIRVD